MGRRLPQPVAGLARLELPELARAADWQWSHARELALIAHHPPHLAAWHCIQHHETNARSAWRTNTGNGYFGGLQFNIGFQLTYGRWLYRAKGTAEHWTPLEQMWTAERAHASGRGFTPWPNHSPDVRTALTHAGAGRAGRSGVSRHEGSPAPDRHDGETTPACHRSSRFDRMRGELLFDGPEAGRKLSRFWGCSCWRR